jgi:sugar phosphate permease
MISHRRYASFYLTRNSLAFTAPSMLEDKSLGLDMTAIGGLTSMLPVAYGFSKFLSGVLGARTSPTFLLAGAPLGHTLFFLLLALDQTPHIIGTDTSHASNVPSQCSGMPAAASGSLLLHVLPSPARAWYLLTTVQQAW